MFAPLLPRARVCALALFGLVACGGAVSSAGDAALIDDSTRDVPAAEGGGAGLQPYANCVGSPRRLDDSACEGPAFCVPRYSPAGQGRVCVVTCDPALRAADCPRAPEGSTTPVCLAQDTAKPPMCILSCVSDPAGCPRGMVCIGSFCVWPR